MQFASWSEFLAMGGYAPYVWASYGLSAVVLGALVVLPILRHRDLRRMQARQARRDATGVSP